MIPQLSPAAFNAFLSNIGQAVSWRKAHFCPCRDPHSGAARYDCLRCSGGGFLWDATLTGYLGISGQKAQHAWAQFGRYENGDVACTLPSNTPLYAMGENDRITFTQSSHPFSLPLSNGKDLPFDAVQIDRVFWLDADQNIVEGSIPEIVGRQLLFAAGQAPPEGISFTVSGRQRPEYYCFLDYPQDRQHHFGKALPRHIILRRFDLFQRNLANPGG